MKVVVGSAVKGLILKTAVAEWLQENGHEVIDVGAYDFDTFVKFTSVAERAAYLLQQGEAERAVLCCGSGTGMALAAGKFRGVCAVSCETVMAAEFVRRGNDANCLCMGESRVTPDQARRMTSVFLSEQFQDVAGVPERNLAFWAEARDEIVARGEEATDRALETLD